LTKKTRANRQASDRKKLAKLEQNALVFQGVSAAEAREQSWQMASAIMESAQTAAEHSGQDLRLAAEAKRKRVKAMLADARSGRYKRPRDRFASLKFALSGYSRLLAGCLLLAVFTFSVQSSGLLSNDVVESVTRAVRDREMDLENLPGDATTDAFGESTGLWSLGIAGVALCLSAFVSGWRMTPFAVAATLTILFGANLGIPAIGPAAPWMVAALIGLVIYLPGIIYGEQTR
jgi:hypothetical protein